MKFESLQLHSKRMWQHRYNIVGPNIVLPISNNNVNVSDNNGDSDIDMIDINKNKCIGNGNNDFVDEQNENIEYNTRSKRKRHPKRKSRPET